MIADLQGEEVEALLGRAEDVPDLAALDLHVHTLVDHGEVLIIVLSDGGDLLIIIPKLHTQLIAFSQIGAHNSTHAYY